MVSFQICGAASGPKKYKGGKLPYACNRPPHPDTEKHDWQDAYFDKEEQMWITRCKDIVTRSDDDPYFWSA